MKHTALTLIALFCMLEPRQYALQFVSGYNRILYPVERSTVQNALVLRVSLNQNSAVSIQFGHNYSIESRINDFRIGLRCQYDIFRW